MLIALLEDDPIWAELVGAAIRDKGWRLIWRTTAEEMLADDRAMQADVFVSDVFLTHGRMDGRGFVQAVRERGITTPILMLTQFAAEHRAAEAFENRADDYLTKPFDQGELIGRIGALERRGRIADPETIKIGPLVISPRFEAAYWNGRKLELADKSFCILACFAQTPGQAVTRATLWQRCWPKFINLDPQDTVIDTAIKKLRREAGAMPRDVLQTVRGSGYRLAIDPA